MGLAAAPLVAASATSPELGPSGPACHGASSPGDRCRRRLPALPAGADSRACGTGPTRAPPGSCRPPADPADGEAALPTDPDRPVAPGVGGVDGEGPSRRSAGTTGAGRVPHQPLVDPVRGHGASTGVGAPTARWRSARWIAVSGPRRRAPNWSGEGASRTVQHSRSAGARRSVATSPSRPSRSQDRSSRSATPPRRIPASSGSSTLAGRASATHRLAHLRTKPRWRRSSRTSQPGQVGPAAPRDPRSAAAASSRPSASIAAQYPGGGHRSTSHPTDGRAGRRTGARPASAILDR